MAGVLGDKPAGRKNKERVPGPRKLLVVNNEMTEVLKKTSIKDSVLAATLCDLWDDNVYEKPIGRGELITVDCRVSWIGGIPADRQRPDRFTELFGAETNYGLYPRFIFGYTDVAFNYKPWEVPRHSRDAVIDPSEAPEDLMAEAANGGVTMVDSLSPEAQELYDNWNPQEPNVGRLRYNLMKVALLTSSMNRERTVTGECMRCAIRFMEWQVEIRRVFQPGEALNPEAQFHEAAIQAFKAQHAKGEQYFNPKRVAHDLKWGGKFGDRIVLQGIKNLIEMQTILPKIEAGAEGKPVKSKSLYRINPKLEAVV